MVKKHLTHEICQKKFGRVKGALLVFNLITVICLQKWQRAFGLGRWLTLQLQVEIIRVDAIWCQRRDMFINL